MESRSVQLTANSPSPSPLRIYAIVGITLVSVALGGSTELWAQGIVALLAATLILIFPPQRIPPNIPLVLFILLMVLALAAFLPGGLGFVPEWRRHLAVDLHVPLGPFRTPQPWITLQTCGLLFFCLVWTAYLLTQEWSSADKSLVLRLLVVGVAFLSVAVIVCYLTGYRIPGWNQEQNRGWFANRNQSANVLAVCGIASYAIAFKSLQKKDRSMFFGVMELILIGAALVICYSRAGIMMFFAGVAAWHLVGLVRTDQRKNFALGIALLLMLLSLFLLFGGTTLERFLKVPKENHPDNYRVLIYEDALRTSMHSPLLGVGLGNFEPVFTSMRKASADQNRTLHPESDWLWMVVEMGWPAALVVLAGIGWWARECLPFVARRGESLRLSAMAAAAMFVLHSFVDVPGHRLGSFLVGLLIATVALMPKARGFPHWTAALLFRGLAVTIGLLGTWWLASAWMNEGPPTTATINQLQDRIEASASAGKLAPVFEDANAALEIAPMDWTYYFRRGSAEAFRNGGTEDAANDFKIGRFLEPNSIDLCVYEGEVWLATDEPTRCLEAWHEALRRAGPKGSGIYSVLLNLSQGNPEVHHGLEDAARTNVDYLIAFLNFATPEEAKSELDDLLARDPNLDSLGSDQQRALFSAWYSRGDQDALADMLLAHSQWQLTGWKFLARHFASQNEFKLATMTVLRYLPQPTIKQISADLPLSTLESNFAMHPDDVVDGVALCQAQIQADDPDAALATITHLEKLPGCPHYVFYLKAQLYVKKEMWEDAWNALQQVDEK